MPYCQRDVLKSRLDITGDENDANLTRIIKAVSDKIDRHCMVTAGGFEATTPETRYYDPDSVHDNVLELDDPILSVVSLVDGSGRTINIQAVRLWPSNKTPYRELRLIKNEWFNWVQDGQIALTAVFGYSSTVPDSVSEAALMYSGWLWKRYEAALQDATVNADLGQLVYSSAIPKAALEFLRNYRDMAKML